MIDFVFKKIKETLVITFRDTKNGIIFEWRRETELAKINRTEVHNKWAVISLMLQKVHIQRKNVKGKAKL